jgi:peptidyl-prolyl cis-trans isomerase D
MALKWLRDNLRHLKFILWGVVAVFIVLVFADWGGAGRSGGGTGDFAIRVGNAYVSEKQYLRELQSTEQQMQSIYGEQWEQFKDQLNLPAQVAQRLIQRELLAAEARAVGLVVSDDELTEVIVQQFPREDGEFVGQQRYEQFLQQQLRMRAREYEEQVRKDLLINKLNQMVQYGTYISDEDVELALRKQSETADFDAIQVGYEQFLTEVELSETDVADYFAEHADQFHRPEQRVVRYLVVETNRLRRTLPISDEEISAYYDEHRHEFVEGEKANARNILFSLPAGSDATLQAETRLRADSVANMAKSGIDFAELVKVHSDDPATKDQGGDLGWFGRGRMQKAVEDAVFGGKPGDIVGPVQTEFGFHLLKVEGFQPERQRPLDEVREQVRFRLLEGRAASEAETRAAALAERVKDLPNELEAWQTLADEDEAVVLNQSPAFSEADPIPGLENNPPLNEVLFEADEGDTGGPVNVPRGWIVWQLEAVHPEGVPELETIRAEVEQKARQLKALNRAREIAEGLVKRWRDGEDGAQLATDAGTKVAEARDHRRGISVSSLGVLPTLENEVFSANVGDVVGPVLVGERAVAIAKVIETQLLDPSEIAAQSEQMRSRLMGERVNQVLGALVNERRRDVVVEFSDRTNERIQSSSNPRG